MTILDLILLATAVLTSGLSTVRPPEQPPVVAVSCATQVSPACCGKRLRFDATFANVNPDDKLSFAWSLTKGRILSGQGTSSIEIDASDPREQPLLVTIEMGYTYQVRVRGRKQNVRGVVSGSYLACPSAPPPNKALQLTAR
jgi:hypothetical protein